MTQSDSVLPSVPAATWRQVRWWGWIPLILLVAVAFPTAFFMANLNFLDGWIFSTLLLMQALIFSAFVAGRIIALPPAIYTRAKVIHLLAPAALVSVCYLFNWGWYHGQEPHMARVICGQWIGEIDENTFIAGFLGLMVWGQFTAALRQHFRRWNRAAWRGLGTTHLETDVEVSPGWDQG